MSCLLLQQNITNMKQILNTVIILGLLTLSACEQEQEGYKIKGEIEDVQDGTTVIVSELDQNNQPEIIDSTAIQNNTFSLDLPAVERPNLSFLSIEGLNGNVMYISENQPIHFEIFKDSLPASIVTGGKENRVFQDYLNHLKSLNKRLMRIRMDARQEMASTRDSVKLARLQEEEEALRDSDIAYKKKLVEENPDTFAAVLALTDMQSMGVPAREVNEYFRNLSPELKETPLAQTLKEGLDKQEAVEIGSKAPEFSGPNPEGEEIALEDVMGKVTLIDFWAAWCKPCRVENPNIVRVYNKYHDEGFNIVGISLDREGQKDRWVQAIEEDNLTWPQISHLEFWEEPIAQLYGVRAIPAQFILDENGVIVAKNLRGDDLEAKVKELLEQ